METFIGKSHFIKNGTAEVLDSTGTKRIDRFRGGSSLQRLGNGIKFLFVQKPLSDIKRIPVY